MSPKQECRCCWALNAQLSHTPLPHADGQLLNDFTGRVRPDQVTRPKGSIRTITVAMDAAQYQVG